MILPLVLVACVGAKVSQPSPARDLYISDWFGKARAYAETKTGYGVAGDWAILSACHGLVSPDTVIAPYEKALNRMPITQRREWAGRVMEQLSARYTLRNRDVIFLAGIRYRELLIPSLKPIAASVTTPMEGLGIGEQLAWMKTTNLPIENPILTLGL